MKEVWAWFGLLLLLSGCASVSSDPGKWRHATKSPEDFRRDYYDCESIVSQKAHTQQSNPATLFTDPSAGGVPWLRKEQRRCLEERGGWEYVGP